MPVDHVINISLHLTEKNVFSCLLLVGITGYSRYSCTLKSRFGFVQTPYFGLYSCNGDDSYFK